MQLEIYKSQPNKNNSDDDNDDGHNGDDLPKKHLTI